MLKYRNILPMTALVGALSFAQVSTADTILGLYIGGDAWLPSSSGAFTSDSSDSSKDFDTDNTSSVYIALEHPIPLVPNIMLRRTSVDLNGDDFAGMFYYDGDNTTNSSVELNQTDAVLYYEILDNGLTSFDVGLNIRKAEGSYSVNAANDGALIETTAFSGYIPMLYAAGEIGILTTGFSVYGDFNAINAGDHSLTDFQAGVAYQLLDNLAVDLSARVGYRTLKVELDDLDGISSDFDISGVTAGIRVHF